MASGCRKTDLSRAQEIFSRWDASWLATRPCLVGKIGRSTDVALQADLAEMFGELDECSGWFRGKDPLPEQDTRASLDSEKKKSADLKVHENIINMWTELRAEDLTDDAAAALETLSEASRALQQCSHPSCPEFVSKLAAVETARANAREQLGFTTPSASPPPALVAKITDVTPHPSSEKKNLLLAMNAGGEADVGAGWRISKQPNGEKVVYTMTNAAGKAQVLDATTMSAVFVLRDAVDPIVWLDPVKKSENGNDFIRVYELANDRWVGLTVGPTLYVGAAKHRLDVIIGGDGSTPPVQEPRAMNWIWFGPGHHEHRITKLRCTPGGTCVLNSEFKAGCSADSVLWEADTGDDQPSWNRWEVVPKRAWRAQGASLAGDIQCDDTAVISGGKLCSTASQDCESRPGQGLMRALVRGKVAEVGVSPISDDDPRRQLLFVRTGGVESYFLLPAKARLDRVRVEDGKLFGVLKGPGNREVDLL